MRRLLAVFVLGLALGACDDGGAPLAPPEAGASRDATVDMLPLRDMAADGATPDQAMPDAHPVDAAVDAALDQGLDATVDLGLPADAAVDAAADQGPPADAAVDAGAVDQGIDAGPLPGCGENPWPDLALNRAGRFVRFTPPGDDLPPRRITVFLPADYAQGDARYPVLYLHDGQNLFDPREAAFGQDWAVDDAIDALGDTIEPLIVVAVDNTDRRIHEYTPTADPEYGGGDAAIYGRFLVERLKPFVDATFRTRCDDTGVGGSSLGGLVSLYLWQQYPAIFSRVAALSPSLWWDGRALLGSLGADGWPAGHRVWIDGGGAEGADLDRDGRSSVIEDNRAAFERLIAAGAPFPSGIALREDPTAEHDEVAWRARLPEVLRYLYGAPPGDPQALSIRAWSQELLSDTAFPLSVDARWPGLVLTLPNDAPEWVGAEVRDGALFSNARGVTVTAAWRGRMAGYENAVRPAVQVEFRVRVPGNPPEEAVWLAGSAPRMGAWDAAGVPLVRDGDVWTVTVPLVGGSAYEYKFNRGGWETVEKGPAGEEIANRRGIAEAGVVEVDVARWADSQ